MRESSTAAHVFILFTLIVGLLVAVYPIPHEAAVIRPELVCLLVIFWVTSLPQYMGIFYAWCIGLLQDIVEGAVWGAHAMALAVVAYICIMAYQRIKNYAVMHQTMWVFVLVGFHQVLVNWIQSMASYHGTTFDLLVSTAMSAIFWPVVYITINRLLDLYRLRL